MFEFAYPWVLTLLAAIPVLAWYMAVIRPRPTLRVPSAAPFRAARRGKHRLPSWTEWCFLAALALLVVALARPRFGDERVVIRSQGIDMILALDLSGSMSAIDLPNNIRDRKQLQEALESGKLGNRLEVAKKELTRFVERRPNDRIGLIGFAPMAYNIAPPTLDHGWLTGHLQRLKPGIIGDATGIAAPLASGVHRLRESKAPRRVMVLFTDGRNNVDNRITPQQAAELAKESDVTIHTVGIGSDNAIVPVPGYGYQPVRHEFDEPMLREIAAKSGGQYFHAEDAAGMQRVLDEINQMETTNFEQPKYVEYRETAPRLALAALVLLVIGFAAEQTWKLRLP